MHGAPVSEQRIPLNTPLRALVDSAQADLAQVTARRDTIVQTILASQGVTGAVQWTYDGTALAVVIPSDESMT